MTKRHDAESGCVRRLVGRLLHHGNNSHTASLYDPDVKPGVATPSWTHRTKKSQSSTSSSAGFRAQHPDADLSLDLWNAAYDALRDSLGSAGLVKVYEAILSQELPHDHGAGGMYSSFGGRSDEERLHLLISVADAGLNRSQASKTSQADESARIILQSSKEAIRAVCAEYPSSAVAWSGICVLTPLLLDPIMHVEDMRRGAIHVLGRIPWYMHLSRLMLRSSWHDDRDFGSQHYRMKESLIQLYRKVLEFEMNCVCATASTWNTAAKNVVGWNGLGSLVNAIHDADNHMKEMMDGWATTEIKQSLMRYDKDFMLPSLDGRQDALHRGHGAAGGVAEMKAVVGEQPLKLAQQASIQ